MIIRHVKPIATKQLVSRISADEVHYLIKQLVKFDDSRPALEQRMKNLEVGFAKLHESYKTLVPLLSRKISHCEVNLANFKLVVDAVDNDFKMLIEPFIEQMRRVSQIVDSLREPEELGPWARKLR